MVFLAALGALVAAACYGAASVCQAIAVRREAVRSGLDLGLVWRLTRQAPYLLGLALDGLGFLASLVALRSLPLFLVEAAVASSVGITAVLAWRLLGARLRRSDWTALAGLAAGLVLLAISAQPEAGRPLSRVGGWVVLAGVAVVLGTGATATRASGRLAAALLAAVAGAAFGGVGVAARALVVPHPVWRLLADPLTYAVVGYGVLGTMLFAVALQRGSVTVAVAINFAVETVLPAAVGLVLLGDSARRGYVPVAAGGFVLTLGAAIAMAQQAQPGATAPSPRPDRAAEQG